MHGPRHFSILFSVTFFCLLSGGRLAAAQFLVAEGGDDRNSGRSARKALATVAAALAKTGSGDTVLLPRGHRFREGDLTVPAGVTLTGFGPEDRPLPILSGSVAVTDLRPDADDPRVLVSPPLHEDLPPVAHCYCDGAPLVGARYPDRGWLFCAEGTAAGRLRIPAELRPAAARMRAWTGADLRWRKGSWWFEIRPITGVTDDGVLTLGGKSSIPDLTPVGSGFYVDGCRAELDAPGEWHWDPDSRRLALIPPEDVDPEEAAIEAAVRETGVVLAGGTLRAVELRDYTGTAVAINAPSRLEDCLICHAGRLAVRCSWNAAGTRIHGNRIRDCWDNGIGVNENPEGESGTRIEANHLTRIGTVPGQGGHGPWHQSGIVVSNAKRAVIRGNRIEGAGYCGVILGSDGQVVERNVVRRAMATLNDGAGIYTNCNASVIRENVVLGSVGCLDSSHPWTPLGHGIWLEFLKEFHDSEVIGNTACGCGGHGIFLPNNYRCRVAENVLVGNRLAGLHLSGAKKKQVPRDQAHVIADNLLGVAPGPFPAPEGERRSDWCKYNDYQRCLSYQRGFDYGTMSGTRFVVPDRQAVLVSDDEHHHQDVDAWRQAVADWADPEPAGRMGAAVVLVNDGDEARILHPPRGSWLDFAGERVRDGIEVPPWRSAVVIAKGRIPRDTPRWVLASEAEPTGN